jgi:hypothetical protein
VKVLISILSILAGTVALGTIPTGISVSARLEVEDLGLRQIYPNESVTVVLTFRNESKSSVELNTGMFDQFGSKLPVPLRSSIRFLSEASGKHNLLVANGGEWTPYYCWSLNLEDTHHRNVVRIPSGGDATIRYPLEEALRVPAGGEPSEWIWDHEHGYQPGSYDVIVSFDDFQSDPMRLTVSQPSKTQQVAAGNPPG